MLHKPTPQHDAFVKDGRRALRWMQIFCKLDLPDEIELPNGPMIFAANHRSLLDVFVANAILAKFGHSCHCLVRADLFDKPVVGNWLRRIGCLPMSSKVKEEAIARAISKIDEGHLVAIMPEGRLMPPEDWIDGCGKARAGVSVIARATNAKVVPVMMHNTELVWPRKTPFPLPKLKRKRVTVRLAPGMSPQSDDDEINANEVMDAIRGLIRQVEA